MQLFAYDQFKAVSASAHSFESRQSLEHVELLKYATC